MPEILQYRRVERLQPPLKLCLIFSLSCLPTLAASLVSLSVLWNSLYGGGVARIGRVVLRFAGMYALFGLVMLWVVALGHYWWRGARSRGTVTGAIAGAAYGVIPPAAFAVAEGVDHMGDWVWNVALVIASAVIPAMIGIWLTSRQPANL